MKRYRIKKILLIAAGVLILILGVEAVLLMQRKKREETRRAGGGSGEGKCFRSGRKRDGKAAESGSLWALLFAEDPGYEKGEVLAAGESEAAEDGFPAKSDGNRKKKDGSYVVKTEPAYLTDVFEKAHVRRSFRITEDGVEEIVREGGQEETAPESR